MHRNRKKKEEDAEYRKRTEKNKMKEKWGKNNLVKWIGLGKNNTVHIERWIHSWLGGQKEVRNGADIYQENLWLFLIWG